MGHAVAQTVLDLIGDFLSRYIQLLDERARAEPDRSSLYPNPPHLEDPNQMDSEGCPCLFSVSYSDYDYDYHYTSLRYKSPRPN